MPDQLRMWVEIIFDCSYLVTIIILVGIMIRRFENVPSNDKPLAQLFILAFMLLTLGDIGHVGFRVIAYLKGNPAMTISLFGAEYGLVGLGSLSTAITVTFFYAVQLMVWHKRFDKPYGWFGWVLFVAGLVRLGIMAFPQNDWSNMAPPYGWSLARNFPLVLQGLGLAYLLFRDSKAAGDTTFRNIAWCIIVSYAFYAPVILFVKWVPVIGMLMIPKTVAYVAIAWIGLKQLFPKQ